MKKFAGILLVLALLSAGAWAIFGSNGETLRAVKPMRGPAVQAVYATGTVEPTIMVPVAPKVSARLTELKADEGQRVEKDQILAQLEDSDLQGRIDEAQAQLDLARKDFNRKAPLAKKGFVSKQDYDQAETTLKAAQATVEQIKAEAGYLQLSAPEPGLIIRRDGEVGELIPAGHPVFFMSCCAPLRISAEVDEEDIALVKPGQKVLISADAFPGEVFQGSLQSITPKGDPVARSYRVRVSLGEDAQNLMIGMTAETNIITEEKQDALLVPVTAVKDGSVWRVKNGRVSKRDVTTGIRTSKVIEITGGIDANEVILQSPPADLEEGARIDTRQQSWDIK